MDKIRGHYPVEGITTLNSDFLVPSNRNTYFDPNDGKRIPTKDEFLVADNNQKPDEKNPQQNQKSNDRVGSCLGFTFFSEVPETESKKWKEFNSNLRDEIGQWHKSTARRKEAERLLKEAAELKQKGQLDSNGVWRVEQALKTGGFLCWGNCEPDVDEAARILGQEQSRMHKQETERLTREMNQRKREMTIQRTERRDCGEGCIETVNYNNRNQVVGRVKSYEDNGNGIVDSKRTTVFYDGNGNVSSRIESYEYNGKQVTHFYNGNGFTGNGRIESYEYNGKKTTYLYDDRNNPLGRVESYEMNGRTVTNNYDSRGTRTEFSTPVLQEAHNHFTGKQSQDRGITGDNQPNGNPTALPSPKQAEESSGPAPASPDAHSLYSEHVRSQFPNARAQFENAQEIVEARQKGAVIHAPLSPFEQAIVDYLSNKHKERVAARENFESLRITSQLAAKAALIYAGRGVAALPAKAAVNEKTKEIIDNVFDYLISRSIDLEKADPDRLWQEIEAHLQKQQQKPAANPPQPTGQTTDAKALGPGGTRGNLGDGHQGETSGFARASDLGFDVGVGPPRDSGREGPVVDGHGFYESWDAYDAAYGKSVENDNDKDQGDSTDSGEEK